MPRWVGYPEKLRKNAAKKYKDGVSEARQKLRIGQEYRRDHRESLWEQSELQYEGKHWDIAGIPEGGSDLIVVNMSFSTVNVIQPYMTGSEPRFLVEPYSGDATVVNAAVQQALLNRLWRSDEISGQEHLEVAAGDFLIYGDGYVKVGYTIKTTRTAEDEWKDVAHLWVQRLDPWDVWLDPAANGLHDARWVCQRIRMTRQELEDDAAYFNTHEENVAYGVGSLKADDPVSRDSAQVEVQQEVFDGSEWATVYEFYDLVHNRMITFSDGELPIRWVDDIGGVPIAQLPNYRIPNSPYHMGELEQLWGLQHELNKTRSHLITHRQRGAAKVFAKEGALGSEAVAALKSPTVMEVAFVKGDQPLDDLVKEVQLPSLSGDVYNVSEMMQADIYEISGVNEYLRGASPDIRRTATEASIIEGASNVKSQYKLRQIEKTAKKIGTIMLRTARDVFPETDYDEIQLFLTGKDADKMNRAANGEMMAGLADGGVPPTQMGDAFDALPVQRDAVISPGADIFVGEYEVEVEHQSTELRNPQLKEQKYRQMVMDIVSMQQALIPMGVVVNVKRLMELWFESAGIDDVDSLFEGQNPMAAQMGMAPGGGGGVGPGQAPGGLVDPSMMGMLTDQNTGALPPA